MARTLDPKITALTPNTADQGDKGIMMVVTGANFVYGSVVKLNGTAKSTTYVSPIELKAEISSKDLLKAGEYDITVYSPIMKGKTSNSEKFTVQTSSGFPWTWIAIGGGAVAAVVVAILTLGGSDDTTTPPATTLANPPVRP